MTLLKGEFTGKKCTKKPGDNRNMIAINNISKKRGINNLRDVEKEKRMVGGWGGGGDLTRQNVRKRERENPRT